MLKYVWCFVGALLVTLGLDVLLNSGGLSGLTIDWVEGVKLLIGQFNSENNDLLGLWSRSLLVLWGGIHVITFLFF